MQLKAPFPYFGGKRKIAADVWRRFGDVQNYVEPFFGSGAVLLARPDGFTGTETVNDADGFISNFWRAVAHDPEAVAHYADWPVNEFDLVARHYWLVTEGRDTLDRVLPSPDGFDAKIAGWWVWGLCSWIGDGWCSARGAWALRDGAWAKRDAGRGINRRLPHLGDAGRGINRQLPHLGNAGQGINRQRDYIAAQMASLSERLRGVRVACGDWSRICGPSVTFKHGITGVFLDPPYGDGRIEYAAGCGTSGEIAAAAMRWAIEHGGNPLMRIAFCGYEGNHNFPDDWAELAWQAVGGYGSQGSGRGRENSKRERVWFSPHCTTQHVYRQMNLFSAAKEA